jgi:preprotein translocase subunit SecF
MLGVDFAGGDELTLRFDKKVQTEDLQKALAPLKLGEPVVQYQRDPDTGKESVRIVTSP